METLTPYARQFLPMLPRADVDQVSGVPPAIALEQRTARGGANSTVATVTEAAHYLRLLYAKVGEPHCPKCGEAVSAESHDASVRTQLQRESKRFTLYAPWRCAREKAIYLDLFTEAVRNSVVAARVDGALVKIDPPPKLKKSIEHSIDLLVYSGAPGGLDRDRFEQALRWGEGSIVIAPGAPQRTKTRRKIGRVVDEARVPELRHRRSRDRSALVFVQHQARPVCRL